jgi:hypothetical protein
MPRSGRESFPRKLSRVTRVTLREYESKILELLKRSIPAGHVIEAAPEDAAQYDAKGARGACLVRFNGARYSTPLPGRSMTRDIEFLILCGSRSLRATGVAHFGAYELLESSRDAIAGKIVAAGEPPVYFVPTSESFALERKGVWWYALTISAKDVYKISVELPS